MNERTPVSAYRLLSSPSIKQKLYVNSRRTPCIIPKNPLPSLKIFKISLSPLEFLKIPQDP